MNTIYKGSSTCLTEDSFWGQYLIGPQKIDLINGLSYKEIGAGIWLSYGDGLNVCEIINKNKSKWFIIGEPYQSDSLLKKPEHEIQNATLTNIEEIISSWAGSWLVIGCGKIFTDASALLRCYHLRITRNPDYVYFFSSSAQILSKCILKQDTIFESAMSDIQTWIVPPLTYYEGIYILLPSQRINVINGEIDNRLVFYPDRIITGYQNKINALIDRYKTIIKNIASENNNLWIPLTGGQDSRFLTALAYHLGLNFNSYTFRTKGYSYADQKIPKIISEKLSLNHKFITKKSFSKKRKLFFRNLFPYHREGKGSTYDYFVNGYFEHFDSDAALLGGSCGEVGGCYYWDENLGMKIPRNPSENDYFLVLPKTKINKRGFKLLRNWWNKYPRTDVDDRERFFWDARIAGWTVDVMMQNKAISQFYNQKRIFPFNCMKTFEITLSFAESDRIGRKYLNEMTNILVPVMKDVPINPRGPLIYRLWPYARKRLTKYFARF